MPTRDEIIAKYLREHDELSNAYYIQKRERAKRIGLYLTPQTLIETEKRRILKQEPESSVERERRRGRIPSDDTPRTERDRVWDRFEKGEHQERMICRECEVDGNGELKFDGKPFKRFKDLTPKQKAAVWEMILDEDEFNEKHVQIWDRCNQELTAEGYEPI